MMLGYPKLAGAAVAAGLALIGAAAAAPAPKPPAAKPAGKSKPLAAPMAFKPAVLDLAPGETYPVELFVPSPTGKAWKGSLRFEPARGVAVRPDTRFPGRIPPWGVKTYPKIAAERDAAGDLAVTAAAGDRSAALTVRVREPEVEPIPGLRKLTVRVTNPFEARLLTGRVRASNPDRFLQNVTAREFRVPPGESQELVFPLPGASAVEGETYDFTLVVETYQGYRSRTTHALSFPQDVLIIPPK